MKKKEASNFHRHSLDDSKKKAIAYNENKNLMSNMRKTQQSTTHVAALLFGALIWQSLAGCKINDNSLRMFFFIVSSEQTRKFLEPIKK